MPTEPRKKSDDRASSDALSGFNAEQILDDPRRPRPGRRARPGRGGHPGQPEPDLGTRSRGRAQPGLDPLAIDRSTGGLPGCPLEPPQRSGEGPAPAELMLLGEQPGDKEDRPATVRRPGWRTARRGPRGRRHRPVGRLRDERGEALQVGPHPVVGSPRSHSRRFRPSRPVAELASRGLVVDRRAVGPLREPRQCAATSRPASPRAATALVVLRRRSTRRRARGVPRPARGARSRSTRRRTVAAASAGPRCSARSRRRRGPRLGRAASLGGRASSSAPRLRLRLRWGLPGRARARASRRSPSARDPVPRSDPGSPGTRSLRSAPARTGRAGAASPTAGSAPALQRGLDGAAVRVGPALAEHREPRRRVTASSASRWARVASADGIPAAGQLAGLRPLEVLAGREERLDQLGMRPAQLVERPGRGGRAPRREERLRAAAVSPAHAARRPGACGPRRTPTARRRTARRARLRASRGSPTRHRLSLGPPRSCRSGRSVQHDHEQGDVVVGAAPAQQLARGGGRRARRAPTARKRRRRVSRASPSSIALVPAFDQPVRVEHDPRPGDRARPLGPVRRPAVEWRSVARVEQRRRRRPECAAPPGSGPRPRRSRCAPGSSTP